MVYINQVGLTNFKSFGGTKTIPLEEGFTVVTGPNGSGKSNILDGVLFCLGLANSKGMRADRLPDLINSGLLKAGKAAETIVSVRFDLSDWTPDSAEEGLEEDQQGPWIKSDQKEWVVTRRLRLMPGGSYSSSYTSNGEQCNLQQLQTQLRRIRVDPEGSNVVMQGDVTRIVSMSNRDRRTLIDELAGVALFDNRIDQTKKKLDDVHEKQERCGIVEQELISAKNRLEKDCTKAKIYQELKDKFQVGKKYELVLGFESAQIELDNLDKKSQHLSDKELSDAEKIVDLERKLSISSDKLLELQQNVKALGEDKLIAVQAELAGLDTQSRELDRQAIKHKEDGNKLNNSRQEIMNRRKNIEEDHKKNNSQLDSTFLDSAEQECKNAEASVEISRRRLADEAGKSGVWIEDQKERSLLRKKLQESINPLEKEQQILQERLIQDDLRLKDLESDYEKDTFQNKEIHDHLSDLDEEVNMISEKIASEKSKLNEALGDLELQRKTRIRLDNEKMKLERDIARLDTRREALQESRGAGALRLLLESGIEGIHGPVAQLGEVDECHRLALEVAAGSRLGQIVVDSDQIAAKAIETLKRRKAGRLTFLPLNKIRHSGRDSQLALAKGKVPFSSNNSFPGLIGKALELVQFERIYNDVFAYVFGDTLVFKDLNSARIHIGKNRSVTLEGELLERSGAMTGGSFANRTLSFSFGSINASDEAMPLRKRLLELGETLAALIKEEEISNSLVQDLKQVIKDLEDRYVSLDAERNASIRSNEPLIQRRNHCEERITHIINFQQENQEKLLTIKNQIKPLLIQLKDLDKKENLSGIENDSSDWKVLQENLEAADLSLLQARTKRDEILNTLKQQEITLERYQSQKDSLLIEENILKESVSQLANSHKQWRTQSEELTIKRKNLEVQQKELQEVFGEQRRARDAAEAEVSKQRLKLQELKWKLDRLREDRKSLEEEIRSGGIRLQELKAALPNPLPQIPEDIRSLGLESLQNDMNNLQQKMEDLEPVNMLALEELEKLEIRLNSLVERLRILSDERSELLLRIETVATLRQEAFMEAFEAVDNHFREIFASLSEGDGHLQLDNQDDPLDGGLTLVAHPKGKPVRRLASMSGGEKSLTALSFLFALQRFRPSPFYALDEVDSFLDGVNVERLSALIASQSKQAQFLVVSHRRPMIGASQRTIGVTQARGAHTQVVGLPNAA